MKVEKYVNSFDVGHLVTALSLMDFQLQCVCGWHMFGMLKPDSYCSAEDVSLCRLHLSGT